MKNKFEIMKQIEKLSHEDKLEIKDWLYGIIIRDKIDIFGGKKLK